MTVSIQILIVPEAETLAKREYYLSDDEVTIGRDYSADITLPDSAKSMSRSHVKISRGDGDAYSVTDLSSNGAKVNGTSLTKNKATPLSDGDVLEFSGYRMLVGIVKGAADADAEFASARWQRFTPETNLDTDDPLLEGEAVEAVSAPQKRGFDGDVLDLDADLMFDPFVDGPEMREPDTLEADPSPDPVHVPQKMSDGVFTTLTSSRHDTSAALVAAREAETRARFYKVAADEAMQRAFDRFLQEIDPETLQAEFDNYIGLFANRKKRYWQIYKRKFSKQLQSGEMRRSFMALFAEEMRRR